MPGALKDQLPNDPLRAPELAEIAKKELASMLARDVAFGANIGYLVAAFSITARFELGHPHPPVELASRTPTSEKLAAMTGALLASFISIEFDQMLRRHYCFQGSMSYDRSQFILTVTAHVGDPYDPKPDSNIMCRITGEAPIEPVPIKSAVIGLERIVKLENPNIDRINHDMPIIVQRAIPPTPIIPEGVLPGEPPSEMINPAGVQNHEFRYDRTKFPAPAEPVDNDISQQAAARMGVPLQTRAGL